MGGDLIPSSKSIKLIFDITEFNDLIEIKDIVELKYKLIQKANRNGRKIRPKIRKIRTDDSTIATAEKYRAELIVNQTDYEKKFKIHLKKFCDTFEFQYIYYFQSGVDIKKFYILDFYIPKKKICFEIDGGHHLKTMARNKDAKRTKRLMGSDIKVYRISNTEVLNSKLIEDKLKFIFEDKLPTIKRSVATKEKKY